MVKADCSTEALKASSKFYEGGLKLAKTAIVIESEHFWYFGHFWRSITMKQGNLSWLIPLLLAVSNKMKAGKTIVDP